MKVVTRFAPSPTGHLHIGGGRTAIFCWLLARHFGGKFRLRIEDTDTERSRQEYTDSILASMTWLGLDWDDELIYQSHRLDVYNMYIDKLLETGHAYWCECTPDEVEAMREVARAKGEKPKYNGKCRERVLGAGPGRVVRLKVPLQGQVVFDDMVKGSIVTEMSELDDMVLRRADGTPTYNMAVVADDHDMEVTHVIRGDDHVSNTPKQILIYQALGFELPIFGHVPMILGPDRQKLSKRHGAKAAIEYQQDGLLPQALVNYLVRLGWSHGDQEIFSLDQLTNYFDGNNLNASAAAFDPEKLQWLNAHYLKTAQPSDLAKLVLPFMKESDQNPDIERLAELIPLYQERVANLKDLANGMLIYFQPVEVMQYEEKAAKTLTEDGKAQLCALAEIFSHLQDFCAQNLEKTIHGYVESNRLQFKQVGPPLRAALIGQSGGPAVHQIAAALRKDETLKRLRHAMQ